MKIKENQELTIRKALSFRGIVKECELDSIKMDMVHFLIEKNIARNSEIITATFGVEGEKIDIELLIPIDKDIDEVTGGYQVKNNIIIKNAVLASYKGKPEEFSTACLEVNKYLNDKHLQPITVGYNVIKESVYNCEKRCTDVNIDIYIGVSKDINQ